jgi:glycosyltransferase involved in cell wall biosynthesis
MSITYILEDHLGGIASFCANTVAGCKDLEQNAILLSNSDAVIRRSGGLGGIGETIFRYSDCENVYSVLKRLRRSLPSKPGAIVSNSGMELAAFTLFPPQQTVYQIVHDQYNLDLAAQYASAVDVFVAHSNHFYRQLLTLFPERSSDIYYLPYGIKLSDIKRTRYAGPIRLAFLGRLVESKGVYDLPKIAAGLIDRGVPSIWTVIGDGPLKSWLSDNMPRAAKVSFVSPPSSRDVLQECTGADVLVLPTRFEGFPVALLEAMSAGLVPVISDLPGGIQENVNDSNGFRIPVGDVDGFVDAICKLSAMGDMLEAKRRYAVKTASSYSIEIRGSAYRDLFMNFAALKKATTTSLTRSANSVSKSRLDRRWIPNFIVLTIRKLIRMIKYNSSSGNH